MSIFIKNRTELHGFAAARLVSLARQAVDTRGRFLFVLSGGGTPQPLYHRLAQPPFRARFPWQQTHFFWGDERIVPIEDPQNNYGQARITLFAHVPVPDTNIHPVNAALPPEKAAKDYWETLKTFADPDGVVRFDAVLLGMGTDGHTASLFPGAVITDHNAAAIPVTADYQGRPANRVTLTPKIINGSRDVIFLVAGGDKAHTLAAVLEGDPDPDRLPAQRIQPTHGRLTWIIDRDAASALSPGLRPNFKLAKNQSTMESPKRR